MPLYYKNYSRWLKTWQPTKMLSNEGFSCCCFLLFVLLNTVSIQLLFNHDKPPWPNWLRNERKLWEIWLFLIFFNTVSIQLLFNHNKPPWPNSLRKWKKIVRNMTVPYFFLLSVLMDRINTPCFILTTEAGIWYAKCNIDHFNMSILWHTSIKYLRNCFFIKTERKFW